MVQWGILAWSVVLDWSDEAGEGWSRWDDAISAVAAWILLARVVEMVREGLGRMVDGRVVEMVRGGVSG